MQMLWRDRDEEGRTTYEKLCSDDIDSLVEKANQLRGGTEGWKECGKCQPLTAVNASPKPVRRQSPQTKSLLSTEAATTAESAVMDQPSAAAALTPEDFALWRPAGESISLQIEPLLASWDAKSYPSQQRLQCYLQEIEAAFAGHLDEQGMRFYLRVEVVRPEGTDLLRHYDLENYLTPIAQRLGNPAVVLAMAEKRHPSTSSDRSRLIVGRVEQGTCPEGWNFHADRLAGSPQNRKWKATLRNSLITAGHQLAAEGALDMVIAWRCDPNRRGAWWNLWKPTGDALGPVLGEPRASNPFNPADDRVVRLDMHYCPTSGLSDVTEVGLWWREATVP